MTGLARSLTAGLLLKLAGLSGSERKRFLGLVAEARSRIAEISPREAAEAIARGAIVLDVREKAEFQRGRIAGAISLPRGLLELEIEKRAPDSSALIIVYCGEGNRSSLAADALQRMGYANVRSLAGGLRAWLEAGGTVRGDLLIED